MLVSHMEQDNELEDLVKNIRNVCIINIINKQNNKHCKCRINACFHAGQMDMALKILRMSGFDIANVKKFLIK